MCERERERERGILNGFELLFPRIVASLWQYFIYIYKVHLLQKYTGTSIIYAKLPIVYNVNVDH